MDYHLSAGKTKQTEVCKACRSFPLTMAKKNYVFWLDIIIPHLFLLKIYRRSELVKKVRYFRTFSKILQTYSLFFFNIGNPIGKQDFHFIVGPGRDLVFHILRSHEIECL